MSVVVRRLEPTDIPRWLELVDGLRRGRETARQAGVLERDEARRMAVRPAAGISGKADRDWYA